MRHSSITLLIVGALLSFHSTSSLAQETPRPDLTGTWALSVDESDFGMSPAPDSALIVVERADERLVMTRTTFHRSSVGRRTTRFDMPADGEVHEADTDDGTTEAHAEWDGAVLVLWVLAQSNIGDIDVTERLGLDRGGGRLLVDREIIVPGMGEFEQSFVFVRR
jgi:hypothetical protein